MKLVPLSRNVGVEVQNLDIKPPFNSSHINELKSALDHHVLLVIRGRELSENDQCQFAEQFGPLGIRKVSPRDHRKHGVSTRGHVMLVTNIPEAASSKSGSYGDGEMWFHADSCYYEIPNQATFLYAIELPSTGGNTRINNMYKAYDNLPTSLRTRLEGRKALQIHDHKRRERINLDAVVIDDLRHFWQPIFVTHPRTRRRALYVNRLMTACIEGLGQTESDSILEDLFAIAEDHAIGYEHEWRVGDLLIWDNYASIHMRTDFPRE
ncbi:MAG: TauD/TfdA family dioxygenase, partial [Phycisphaerae bacterium]|nr:TauD/TfdA family dioxygenase [Phycisphaerae bacterium]NIP54270.1 TauD/TfdA family dioxygenase [Phycisphaerae bacterium]NIX30311.1 hypothetical protein [Phycisphaerae bacterium]